MVSEELQTQVATWREKARQGTLTQDEMREAIKFLRAERMAMPASPSKAKSKAATVNVNDLFGELDGL